MPFLSDQYEIQEFETLLERKGYGDFLAARSLRAACASKDYQLNHPFLLPDWRVNWRKIPALIF
jgi:hypothetical protein